MSQQVVVVGAGIIGLSSAVAIADKYPNAVITIVAKYFPEEGLHTPNYTTNKSGAHFRPFPSKSDEEYRDSKFTRDTYKKFKLLSKEHPESSIKFVKGIDYLEKSDPLYENLERGYKEGIDEFKVIDKELLPAGISFGAEYKTFIVNPQSYLIYLMNKLNIEHHAEFKHMDALSLKQIAEEYPNCIIINCTGRGLLFDGSYDKDSYPIRGQTLLVRPPKSVLKEYQSKTITYQLANGEWTFVIPRPLNGGLIVGGTKLVNSSKANVDDKETESLISNAKLKFPDLFNSEGNLDILKVNVGFRPARVGGVRLERQVVKHDDKFTTIVHCYGFGGCGVEMSWGAALKVADLVEFKSLL
ncbi:hypothetical protein DAMA08_031500 [Martiniozyma asiatica (nom. inval.)]|nr:hypothetical protein DAMA08_031500 [Martiniozyma asiatica]